MSKNKNLPKSTDIKDPLVLDFKDPNTEWADKITIIGSGQIAAVIGGFLALQNRERVNKGEKPVKISILGRKQEISGEGEKDSESITAMKENGIVLNYKEQGGKKRQHIGKDEILFTSDAAEIGNNDQDHVIITTKAFDHDEDILTKVESLRKNGVDKDTSTTVTFAQNGIPCWFMNSIRHEEIELESLKNSSEFLNRIGIENMVGCILNVASNVHVDSDTKIPIKHEFDIATPFEKIEIPIDFTDGVYRPNLAKLHEEFIGAGIRVQPRGMEIKNELLLKIQVNAAINGICAITGKKIGEIMSDPSLSIVALAAAKEVDIFSRRLIAQELRDETALRKRLENSATHYPSMERDFVFGNKMEIDQIYRAPVEISQKLKLPYMNVMSAIADILEKMEKYRDSLVDKSPEERVEEARLHVKDDVQKLINMARSRYRPPTPPAPVTPDRSILHSNSVSSLEEEEVRVQFWTESSGEKMVKVSPNRDSYIDQLYGCVRQEDKNSSSSTKSAASLSKKDCAVIFRTTEAFQNFKQNIKVELDKSDNPLLRKTLDKIDQEQNTKIPTQEIEIFSSSSSDYWPYEERRNKILPPLQVAATGSTKLSAALSRSNDSSPINLKGGSPSSRKGGSPSNDGGGR